MSVFLGPNGSGKTTFFDVFGFLKDALTWNVHTATSRRGGFAELLNRSADPAKDTIDIEVKFRNKAAFKGESNPLITYELKVGFDAKLNRTVVRYELLKYRRGAKGKPWHFLEFKDGEGQAILNEEDYGKEGAIDRREAHVLDSPEILALKGLGQFKQYRAISDFRQVLERWHISQFNINEAQKDSEVAIDSHLDPSGSKLAQVTKYLYDYHRQTFDAILEKLPQRIPGIVQVEAIETPDNRILLRFKDKHFDKPFLSRSMSDGTIKMFAYLVLLNDPDPHPLICIEEPENYLHPQLLHTLAEEIREYSNRGGQVLVSTHSPDFVDACKLQEVFMLIKDKGHTRIVAATDDDLVRQLNEAGNELGYLWRTRQIEAANLSR